MHPADNVAIVANTGGLPSGSVTSDGLTFLERIPEGHKVALGDIARGQEIRRYDVSIGTASHDLPAGSWVNEARLTSPPAPDMNRLPVATRGTPLTRNPRPATFLGYRNPDGSVGTRNLLGITSTVQCVSGVLAHAVTR